MVTALKTSVDRVSGSMPAGWTHQFTEAHAAFEEEHAHALRAHLAVERPFLGSQRTAQNGNSPRPGA
jgi:hypothetical protein